MGIARLNVENYKPNHLLLHVRANLFEIYIPDAVNGNRARL